MSLNAVTSIVWLFALLTAVALRPASLRRPAEIATAAAAALAALGAGVWLQARPEWVGVAVGALAVWRLVGKPSALADNLACGVCLGLAAALHVAQGLNPALAAAIAAGAFGAAVWLAQGLGALRGWSLVIAALAAPAVGLSPALAYGWRSAEVLNRAAGESLVRPIPWWALVWVGLALVAGVVRGLWVRR